MGRRGAVEVPLGRLGRAVGGAAASARSRRRPTRTRATAPTGSRCCARGSAPPRSSSGSSRPTTDAPSGSSGSSTRDGGRASFTGPQLPSTGPATATAPCYAAQGNILVGAETVDALAGRSRRRALPLAAAADRMPRRRAGSGRRPPRAAVRIAPRRRARRRLRRRCPTSSSTCASTTTRARSRSCADLRLHDRLFGTTPREDWLPLEGALRDEVGERLARLGYDDELDGAARLGRRREPRGARRRRRRDRSVVLEALREDSERRLHDPLARRDRRAPRRRHALDPVRDHLGFRPFGINAYTAGCGRPGGRGHTEETAATRRSTPSSRGHATFTVDGEEVDAPAGTLVYLPAERLPHGDRRGGRDDRARDRRRQPARH